MSNTRCCVPGCVNNKAGSKEILHKFPNPLKNRNLFNTWVYSIGGDILQLQNDHIFKHRRVCHIHFEEKYWCRNNRLSNIALPTKDMPGLSLSKFRGEGRTLGAIQVSLPSTSRGPVVPLLYLAGDDVEMKENLDPRTKSLTEDKDVQSHHMTECEEIKEKPESARYLDHAPERLSASSIVDVPIKVNTDPPIESLTEDKDVQSHHMTECVEIKEKPESARYLDHAPERLSASSIVDVPIKVNTGSLKSHKSVKKHVKRVAVTLAEQGLYKKIKQLRVKLSKSRNTAKKQAIKLKSLKNLSTNKQFVEIFEKISSTSKILTLLQIREHKKEDKGRRFTMKEKILALSLLKQSPKGYRFFRKIFILPSRQTLLKLLHMANINAGINENIFMQIKKAAEKMKTIHKLCIVIFDEMSLKSNVIYNERKDRVSGFVTNGEQTLPEFADHAQVFMVRGLVKNFKQPVAYTFSQSATKGPELAKQLKMVITALQNAGLIVVGTVCDQGTNNVNCVKYLIQETRGDYLRRGEEPKENVFLINNEEVFPLYDPPHLIKCIRNNLLTKHLKFTSEGKSKIAKWDHILLLYKENPAYKGIRCMKKLTAAHCDPSKIPRMKVKFATQVFSKTMASNMGYYADKGILPAEAKDTADLLLLFDDLFDSVNGSYQKKTAHGKPLLGPVTPTSIHHKLWKDTVNILRNMKFINKNNNKIEYVPTIKNWVWTLEGIDLLLKHLHTKYGVTSVWLRHLNQDPIENFFGSIRSHGCRNVNPTPDRFEAAYATLLVNSLSSAHAPGANCESDDCHTLTEVLITGGGSKVTNNCDFHIPDIIITPLEDKNDPRVIGGLQYVGGYFLKNMKQNVFKGCVQCKKDLNNPIQPEYIRYREYANKEWLCSPSDSLLNCVSNLQDIIYIVIKENLEKENLKEFIKTIIFMCIDFNFMQCEKHKAKNIEFLLKISCRFFIHNYCKDINNILINKRELDDDSDLFKLKAQKMFYKCFKRKQ